MQTFTHGAYRAKLTPTRNVGEFAAKLAKCNGKSRRLPLRDLRTKSGFPVFTPGMSTAEYVKAYSSGDGSQLKAWEWSQLNDAPCMLYSGEDTCETLPDGFDTWEDFDAAQSADAAPESTLAAANDDAAPTVPDPEPAAHGEDVAAPVPDLETISAWSAAVNGAVRRGLDRTPIQHLPNYARMAIERADADSGLRSTAKVSELVRAYAATHGAIAEEWEIASALYICGRRFWDFDAAPDGAPVAAPIETAPAEVAPPHCAIGDPLTTQSDSVPVPGKLDATPVRPDYPDVWAAWCEVRNGRADPDIYQARVIECMDEAIAGGLYYNSETYPAAARLMAERYGYPDARTGYAKESGDASVASDFGTDCYNARAVIRQRAEDAADKAAADGFQAGQKFARLMFNDYKLCTGAVLHSLTHTGKECRLTGKRAGRAFEVTCTATTLQNAIERAAERAAQIKAKRARAKPAPAARAPIADPVPSKSEPNPVPGKLDAAPAVDSGPPASDSSADPAEVKREADRAAALADAMARFTRGARVTAEPAHYFDGQPVAGWPNAQFLGTVRECFDNRGMATVRVKWDSGRTDLTSAARLAIVPLPSESDNAAPIECEPAPDVAAAVAEPIAPMPAEPAPVPSKSEPAADPFDAWQAAPNDPKPTFGAYSYAKRTGRTVIAYCGDGRIQSCAKAAGMRYVHRAKGFVGTPRQAEKMRAAWLAGAMRNAERAKDGVAEPGSLRAMLESLAVPTHAPLPGDTKPEALDDDETIPAPLDGLDVAELDDMVEFERAGGIAQPIAPAYRDDAPRATPIPSLRIPAGDPRARIPARFARVYLLQA